MARSLRSAALAAWCPGGTVGDAAGEAPPVAGACCFPQPRSGPAASRGLCSAVVRGTTYINGGCLACAHQQRVGWGVVRARCGALVTLVPEDLPYGCACSAGPPVGVTPWRCTGTSAVARSPGWGGAPAQGNGSGDAAGSEGPGQAAAGLLAAPRTGCLAWLQLPFGKGRQSQLPEGEWDLL